MSVSEKFLRLSVGVHNAMFTAKRAAIGATVSLLALNPVMALAEGNLADMFSSAATGADETTKSGVTIARALGFFSVLGGFIALKNKKDNPQIKPWHIALAVGGGIFLIALPEMIKRSQNQLGLKEVDIGG